ncbi:MAG: DUF58 domain-containing protein [Pseudomonadota bacterium]
MILSRLSIACLALIAVLGIVEQWLAREGFALWRVAAILLCFGLIYERTRIRGAQISAGLKDDPELRLGRVETLHLRFENLSSRELVAEMAPGLPEGILLRHGSMPVDQSVRGTSTWQLELAPRQGCDHSLRVQARDMGNIPWGQLPTRLRGPLGLAHWRTPVTLDVDLAVVPDTSGTVGVATGEARVGNRAIQVGHGLELHHLREYVDGDPIQRIDWKATARSQRLISRVYSEDQHLEIMLLVDVGRSSLSRVDGVSQYAHYCNLIVQFAKHAVAAGDHVGVVIAAGRPLLVQPPVSGPRAVSTVRNTLVSVNPSAEETDLVAAAIELQKATRKRALVVLFTDLYGQSADSNLARSIRFLRVHHKPVAVGLLGADIVSLIEAPADSERDVFQSLAAQEFRTALRRNAEGLRRLGASAVISRPSALHRAVLDEYRRLKQQHRV